MGNSVNALTQIHSGICMPKVIKIERGLVTQLLRKQKGCIFASLHT